MGSSVLKYLSALPDYLFPVQCKLCGRILQRNVEELICSWCLMALPRTGFRRGQNHQASQTFWGRCRFEHVHAFLQYRRHNTTQKLIYQLKYHQSPETGLFLGKLLGKDLFHNSIITSDHVLVPVPLHPKKEKKRGYNQSTLISQGIQSACPVTIEDMVLLRNTDRESQTRKSRFSRSLNTEGLFGLHKPDLLENRKVVLVDDVITTGSTMEACAQLLEGIPGIQLSAAAVAFSNR